MDLLTTQRLKLIGCFVARLIVGVLGLAVFESLCVNPLRANLSGFAFLAVSFVWFILWCAVMFDFVLRYPLHEFFEDSMRVIYRTTRVTRTENERYLYKSSSSANGVDNYELTVYRRILKSFPLSLKVYPGWETRNGKINWRLSVAFFFIDGNFSLGFHSYPPGNLVADSDDHWADDQGFGFYVIETSLVWRWRNGYWSWDIPFYAVKTLKVQILEAQPLRTANIRQVAWTRPEDKAADLGWDSRRAVEEKESWVIDFFTKEKSREVRRRVRIHADRYVCAYKWLPFFPWNVDSLDFSIVGDGSLGKEQDSWKGGVIGFSERLEKHEDWRKARDRAEAKYSF